MPAVPGPELQNRRKAHFPSRALHPFDRDGQTYCCEVPTRLEVGISECGTKIESHIPKMLFIRPYPGKAVTRRCAESARTTPKEDAASYAIAIDRYFEYEMPLC